METVTGSNSRNLMINQLGRGKKLAKQLHGLPYTSDSSEMRRILLDEILFTFSKALGLVNYPNGGSFPPEPEPSSLVGGCGSGHGPSKRRKTLPRRLVMVKPSSKEGEGPEPTDCYSWRKYGSKIILGAKFRRGYYRCSYSHSQCCSALKIVQRSDEDPSLFQVTYVGDHTCTQSSHVIQATTTKNLPPAQPAPKDDHFHQPQQQTQVQVQLQQAASPISPDKTVELDSGDQEKFYFRCLSLSTRILDADHADVENWLPTASPETPDSNHLLSSPASVEPDFQKGVSTPNSVMNSPFDDLEFSLDELGIDTDFSFDVPELSP